MAKPSSGNGISAPPGEGGRGEIELQIPADAVPNLVCAMDGGRITYINTAGLRILRADAREDVVGSRLKDHLAADYRELFDGGFADLLAEEAPLPVKIVRLDGTSAELEITITRIAGRDESQLLVVGREITELKQGAMAILERERRITAILDNVAEGVISIDETGVIESFNRAAQDMFGITAAEAKGRNVKTLMTDADSDQHDSYLEGYVESDVSKVIGGGIRDLLGRRKDGTVFPIELTVSKMVSGGKRAFIGAVRDVSEHKQAQAVLRDAIEAIDEGFALYDAEDRLIMTNSRFCEMTLEAEDMRASGASFEELLRKSTARRQEGMPDIDPEDWVERRLEYHRDPVGFIERPAWDGRWVRINESRTRDGGIVAIHTDITEQKNFEERIREAEKLNSLGQLAGGIAHDFNNLLMVIGGYSKRALAAPTDEERVRDSLSEVVMATEKAVQLTKQLLAFGRRQVLEKKVVRGAAVIQELKTLLLPLFEATIQLTVEIGDEALCVETDPSELSQALMNLAINGRDAMPGGGELRIGMEVVETSQRFLDEHPDASSDAYVKFQVSDDGTGMDAETKARIFEPFFTTKVQGKGTGLGLAMVYGFIQQCGGLIDVETTLGEGTTFNIYLPLVDKAPKVIFSAPEEEIAGKGETILLAEDDDALRRLAQTTLEDLGYKVLAAANGFEALEIESDHEGVIDLLLSDVVMPELGGFELTHAVLETRPEIKVILMSGYPSRGDLKRVALPEEIPLLQKPLDPDTMARSVRRSLDGREVAPGSAGREFAVEEV
jgi:PAS domain S-box-containing protein